MQELDDLGSFDTDRTGVQAGDFSKRFTNFTLMCRAVSRISLQFHQYFFNCDRALPGFFQKPFVTVPQFLHDVIERGRHHGGGVDLLDGVNLSEHELR